MAESRTRPTWDVPTEPGVDVEGSSRWVHASVLLSGQLFPDKASREAVARRDAARILDVDPRLFRRLNNNALDADGRITALSGWLVAPERVEGALRFVSVPRRNQSLAL